MVYISYVGTTKIASVVEEVTDPERNLPLRIFLAMGTSVFVYVLGTIAALLAFFSVANAGILSASRYAGWRYARRSWHCPDCLAWIDHTWSW